MPVFDRFGPSLERRMPYTYAVSVHDTATIERLRRHGVRIGVGSPDYHVTGLSFFTVDSVQRAPRLFQGHHEVRVFGRWGPSHSVDYTEWMVVQVVHPKGRLAAILLDPESDDGLATWDMLDHPVTPGTYPIARSP